MKSEKLGVRSEELGGKNKDYECALKGQPNRAKGKVSDSERHPLQIAENEKVRN